MASFCLKTTNQPPSTCGENILNEQIVCGVCFWGISVEDKNLFRHPGDGAAFPCAGQRENTLRFVTAALLRKEREYPGSFHALNFIPV